MRNLPAEASLYTAQKLHRRECSIFFFFSSFSCGVDERRIVKCMSVSSKESVLCKVANSVFRISSSRLIQVIRPRLIAYVVDGKGAYHAAVPNGHL